MPLVGTLESSFGQDGFSLDGEVGALGTSIGGIAPRGATLDSSALGSIAGRIGGVDLGAISTAAGSVAGTAQAAGGALPSGGDLMRPLGSALSTGQTLTGAQTA